MLANIHLQVPHQPSCLARVGSLQQQCDIDRAKETPQKPALNSCKLSNTDIIAIIWIVL